MKQLIPVLTVLLSFSAVAQPKWQQKVDTKINVRLDDIHHFLYADEELTYTNNSPDTLHYIYIHLWPNAYKNDRTPLEKQFDKNHSTAFYFSKPQDKGYIDSLQFTIDGQAVDYYSAENTPDIARIDLLRPLLPGQNMHIATPFKVKIPKVFSRMGHTRQAYYISQWFPKPAVYDQKGWHPIPYLDQGEFFSEYGSYDVTITLPKNYVVMATGNCLDQKENDWMDELAKKPLSEITFHSKKARRRYVDPTPPSESEMKTLHYHEDNIHDFAWFADKRWVVRKDTVYSPGNGQLVTTWAAFMPSYWKTWQHATWYLKETVLHYGKWVGPYQYKTIKAVLGDMRAGGGMEYPTVTIIDKSANSDLQTTIVHEAGHNWFYGMLGSMERDHAWMDEGINTFYEEKTDRALDTVHGKQRTDQARTVLYERMVAHTDQAIEQTSADFEKLNYGLDVYYKTASILRWLESYMGEADFEAGMHDYYNTWHFHHPYPEDFKICIQKHTSKSLDWFFDTMLTTKKKIDFTILKAKINGDNTDVVLRNNTGVYAPLHIEAYRHDSLTADAWSTPFTGKTTITLPGTNWNTIRVDSLIPDAKSDNNEYRRKALFHHFGLQLKPFAGWNNGDKDRLFISPALGYNQYDGVMAGIVLHDLTIPENRFRFVVAPLYSFQTQSVVGAGSVGYMWYPNNIFRELLLQVDGKTFHYNDAYNVGADNQHVYAGYSKIAPSLNFTFDEHDATSPVTRTLTLKGYYISEDNFTPVSGSTSNEMLQGKTANNYGRIEYKHRNNRTYNPFNYSFDGQLGADFAKVSTEGNIRIDYNTPKKAMYVRAFLGKFFPISSNLTDISRYELNATYSGIDDYLYDGTYFARSAQTGFASQQISMQEGGFKVPTYNNAATSQDWMATINLSTDLPKVKLIRLFFDGGLIPNATPSFTHSGSTTVLYDGGVEIHIINNMVSLYIPIIMSNDFQNFLTNTYGRNNVFMHSISFTMQLQNLNWLKAPAGVLKNIAN